jgi:TRAP-type mannitol/chloroaromatic compound transport system substrate-binding protein
MKKEILVFAVAALLVGCTKEDIVPIPQSVSEELKMTSSVGIKLQTVFVTSEVAMNVKTETAGQVTIKIFDIANRVVSKETMNVVAGDNVLKVYTSALPSSAYRIGLFDANGKQLGITDFNKL